MHQHQALPDRILSGAYMPVGVADELTGLLIRLRSLMADTSIEALGPVTLAGGETFDDTELGLKIVLADLDHLLDLADRPGRHVGADRWERVTRELRSVVLSIAARA